MRVSKYIAPSDVGVIDRREKVINEKVRMRNKRLYIQSVLRRGCALQRKTGTWRNLRAQ